MTGRHHPSNDRHDILGANGLGRALFLEMFDGQERPNAARFVFLNPRAREFYLDWDCIARDVVAPCARPPTATRLTTTLPTSSASSRLAARNSGHRRWPWLAAGVAVGMVWWKRARQIRAMRRG